MEKNNYQGVYNRYIKRIIDFFAALVLLILSVPLFLIIGLIIAIAIDKSETKRGAVTGFIISIVISVVAVGCVICSAGAALEGIIYNVTPIL